VPFRVILAALALFAILTAGPSPVRSAPAAPAASASPASPAATAAPTPAATPPSYPAPVDGTYAVPRFTFADGETMENLRLHYVTLGTPHRDAAGHVDNAVLVLHGTGGDTTQFLRDVFAGVLFVPGGVLDASKFFIVITDGIGHGQSSKPSDGLHARFPHYGYRDMVRAQHDVLVDALHVDHLRLVMGTSMGGMQTWLWGETYPTMMDALMPLASLPVQIGGRNRIWRDMIVDDLRNDPGYAGGEYKAQPHGLKAAVDMLWIFGSAPLYNQSQFPTRDQADAYYENAIKTRVSHYDANDMIYQFESSRDYDPQPGLGKIVAPLLAINSADDQINPPELGIMEREIEKVRHGRFVLLPISRDTRGHGTHTLAREWYYHLADLLRSRIGIQLPRRSDGRAEFSGGATIALPPGWTADEHAGELHESVYELLPPGEGRRLQLTLSSADYANPPFTVNGQKFCLAGMTAQLDQWEHADDRRSMEVQIVAIPERENEYVHYVYITYPYDDEVAKRIARSLRIKGARKHC
jgi:homoserine O-acetyltransferase/O-succinyltransferase